MKKSLNTFRWIGVAFFGIMSAYAFSERGLLGGVLFLLGGAIIAPLGAVQKIRGKLKLNKAISIVLAVLLLFAGSTATPTIGELTDNTVSSQISETESNNNSYLETSKESSSKVEEISSKEETISSSNPEETSKPSTSNQATEQDKEATLSKIPAFSGKAFVVINNNIPSFSKAELKSVGYETYAPLDSLGRTRTAIASVGKDTMPKPDEERGSISSIKPSGWKQAKYSSVSGGWLYNRCHLIGWQLSAENANKKNLITGTKYLNIEGMLPFENMVADYIKETGNHVAYRITPIYEGDNLLASGIQMEAFSVEDDGEGICFNVYCYNVQPNIIIDYATGKSTEKEKTTSSEASK